MRSTTLISAALAACLAVPLAACSASDNDPVPTTANVPGTGPSASDPGLTVAPSQAPASPTDQATTPAPGPSAEPSSDTDVAGELPPYLAELTDAERVAAYDFAVAVARELTIENEGDREDRSARLSRVREAIGTQDGLSRTGPLSELIFPTGDGRARTEVTAEGEAHFDLTDTSRDTVSVVVPLFYRMWFLADGEVVQREKTGQVRWRIQVAFQDGEPLATDIAMLGM